MIFLDNNDHNHNNDNDDDDDDDDNDEGSCTNCSTHRTRFYVHTLRKDRAREVRDGAGTVRLKKFFKGWTILNEI